MNITLTGSLGNISKNLVHQLVSNGHTVKVISSKPEKAAEIEQLQALPLIGSVEDPAFVTTAFAGSDAVYTMVPPDFSVADYTSFSNRIHHNYAKAIEENNIRYVVNLSSIGSALAGTPPLEKYYNLENKLNTIVGLNVVHLRPGMFYTNFYGAMEMIRHQHILGHNIDQTVDMVMTDPADIANAAFFYLNTLSFSGSSTHNVISDVKNGGDVARLLGKALDKTLNWVAFPDEQLLAGLMQNGIPAPTAQTYIIAMGQAMRQGMLDQYSKNEPADNSPKQSFESFAATFAGIYNAQN